jgi:cellulose 1,4-beta-cellobiosidase
VLDANWRWLHTTTGYTNCYTGNEWDTSLCPDATTCAKNCALDGADYSGTYGVSTSGNAATLNFVTQNSNGQNVGSRLYLMDTSDAKYQGFNLINQEFTLTVDMSQLGCGLNGAVYFSEMALDGGMSTQPNNAAGAKYGTGYCDSQCPRDLKVTNQATCAGELVLIARLQFIGGYANVAGWTGTTTNSGKGQYGSCCSEMDIWEANQFAEAVTPHPCSSVGLARTDCTSGTGCSAGGVCDPAGCDFNAWRMGNQTFLGPGSGFVIDTTKPIQVVTQFISSDGTANGDLTEIRRKFVQNGKVFDNAYSNIPGLTPYNSITDATCQAQKTAFGDTNYFAQEGGLKTLGQAFKRGMVLVLSIWDDTAVNMLWLGMSQPARSSRRHLRYSHPSYRLGLSDDRQPELARCQPWPLRDHLGCAIRHREEPGIGQGHLL